MALQGQDGTEDPLEPLLSRHAQITHSEENGELTDAAVARGSAVWTDVSFAQPSLFPPHAEKTKQHPANGGKRRTSTRSQDPTSSRYPVPLDNPSVPRSSFASHSHHRAFDGLGPPPRPGGEIIGNNYGYPDNNFAYASPIPSPPFAQQIPGPQVDDRFNPFSPEWDELHHAQREYDTHQAKYYPQAGPYDGARVHHEGRAYYQGSTYPQPPYPPIGQPYPSPNHYRDPREIYWNPYYFQHTPHFPHRTVSGRQQRSPNPRPSLPERDFYQFQMELKNSKRLQQEAQIEEKAKKEAAERKREIAESKKKAIERERKATEREKKATEREKKAEERERKAEEQEAEMKRERDETLLETNRREKNQQRTRELEVLGTRRDPARTQRPWSDYEIEDAPSLARQIEVGLPIEGHGKLRLVSEHYLRFLESRIYQPGQGSSEGRQREGGLDHSLGPSTHGLDVTSRPLHDAGNDAILQNKVEELINFLHRLPRDSPLFAKDIGFSGSSSNREAPRQPKDFPALASALCDQYAVPAGNRSQEDDPLPLRTSGSTQTLQESEGFGQDSKPTSDDPWGAYGSPEADQEPTNSGYASLSTRFTSRSGSGHHTNPAILRKGRKMPAQNANESKQSEETLRGQSDRHFPRYQEPQASPCIVESDESDCDNRVLERERAPYPHRMPEAPDPPPPLHSMLDRDS